VPEDDCGVMVVDKVGVLEKGACIDVKVESDI
jgi:hypothetical protein